MNKEQRKEAKELVSRIVTRTTTGSLGPTLESISQSAKTAGIDLSRQTLHNWARGKHLPSWNLLELYRQQLRAVFPPAPETAPMLRFIVEIQEAVYGDSKDA